MQVSIGNHISTSMFFKDCKKLHEPGVGRVQFVVFEKFASASLFKNWFMLSVRISSYGCTRDVWRARKKREGELPEAVGRQ